jgi:hypothetical protein
MPLISKRKFKVCVNHYPAKKSPHKIIMLTSSAQLKVENVYVKRKLPNRITKSFILLLYKLYHT